MADLRIEESPGHVLAPAVSEAEERVSLASNRQLIWWRFRKHRVPIALFPRGYTYSVLGLFRADIHLLGTRDDGERRIFLLGTDRLGRDQWSRLMLGTRTSMTVGLLAVTLSVIIGAVMGGLSGYFGGWLDLGIQRVIELLQSLPTIPIWLAMTAALPQDWPPQKGFFAITIILALIGW